MIAFQIDWRNSVLPTSNTDPTVARAFSLGIGTNLSQLPSEARVG